MTMTDLYIFLCGPMLWVAVGVFVAGTVWHIIQFHRFTRKRVPRGRAVVPQSRTSSAGSDLIDSRSLKYRLARLKLTLPGQRPFFILMTNLFHLNLLILPFFIQGHTTMVGYSFGIYLPSLPDVVIDLTALVSLLCVLFFLARRLFVREVRAITTFSDFSLLALAAAPFITGFLACHQIFDYQTMIFMHIISGELMLILIPFTRLIHMVYFFLNRFYMIHHYTLDVWGNRAWKTGRVPFNVK